MSTAELNTGKEGARVGVVTSRDSLGFMFSCGAGADYYLKWKDMDRHIAAGAMTYKFPMHEGRTFVFTFKPER